MAVPIWKLNLQPASYKGVQFHVEADTRSGGRRLVPHEFPKKDVPYTEDMGRRVRRFSIVGYIVGPDYQQTRDTLVTAFEDDAAGDLNHPTYQFPGQVLVDTYSMTETRERGGYVQFEAMFIEAGQGIEVQQSADTQDASKQSADKAVGANGNSTAFDIAQQYAQTGIYGGLSLIGSGFGVQIGFSAAGINISASLQPGLLASADFSGW